MKNVDPLEVEAALLDLPGVDGARVFGTPSAQFGQVVSVVVTSDPTLGRAEKLAELLADRLARHKHPRRALRADSLPMTASGKIDRRACALRWGSELAS